MEYKVLWVDDKPFDALENEAEDWNINITRVSCWAEAQPLLEQRFNEWDALILDCYCSIESGGKPDDHFLTNVFARLNTIQGKMGHIIPWFVLSQGNKERFDWLIDAVLVDDRRIWDPDWEQGYYSKTGFSSKYRKPDYQVMLDNIVKAVQATDAIIVRKKHEKAFLAAKFIGEKDVESDLQNFLVLDYRDILNDTENYYNWVRYIMECIFVHGKKEQIFPPLSELNSIGTILEKGVVVPHTEPGWKIVNFEKFVPKALGHAFRFLLDYSQQGSHYMSDDNVRAYVKESGNINLFRALLHLEMDLLVWYHDLWMKVHDPNNKDLVLGNLWIPYIPNRTIRNLEVKTKMEKFLHYYVETPETTIELKQDMKKVSSIKLKEGALVDVKNYREGNQFPSVAECFSYPSDYEILYKKVTVVDQNSTEIQKDSNNGRKKATASGIGDNYKGFPSSIQIVPQRGFFIQSVRQNCGQAENINIENKWSMATIEIPKLEDDVSFVVTLLPNPTLQVAANNIEAGIVSGGGQITPGNSVSLSAEANPGYRFIEWQGGEFKNSKNKETTYVMQNRDVKIFAIFEKVK